MRACAFTRLLFSLTFCGICLASIAVNAGADGLDSAESQQDEILLNTVPQVLKILNQIEHVKPLPLSRAPMVFHT